MAATNKCLAQSNKPETGGKATKKRPDGSGALMRRAACGATNNECDYENRDGALAISASIVATANAQDKIYGVGVQVHRKDDPCHVGTIRANVWGTPRVVWNDTGWIEDVDPCELMRVENE